MCTHLSVSSGRCQCTSQECRPLLQRALCFNEELDPQVWIPTFFLLHFQEKAVPARWNFTDTSTHACMSIAGWYRHLGQIKSKLGAGCGIPVKGEKQGEEWSPWWDGPSPTIKNPVSCLLETHSINVGLLSMPHARTHWNLSVHLCPTLPHYHTSAFGSLSISFPSHCLQMASIKSSLLYQQRASNQSSSLYCLYQNRRFAHWLAFIYQPSLLF